MKHQISNTKDQIFALSIAGFDPSGGAGVLADIKTMDAFGVYGFAVCSALTYQNDVAFNGVDWISINKITAQIDPLITRFPIEFVKIGFIENLEVLMEIIGYLKIQIPNLKLIWDPILKTTSGSVIHDAIDKGKLKTILSDLLLITPNIPEALALSGMKTAADGAKWLSQYCPVLLKGGHSEGDLAIDFLYYDGDIFSFESPKEQYFQKHGTGCVLSSAITANLAKGYTLPEACDIAKKYIHSFISSTEGLLGKHHYEFIEK